MDKNFVGAPCQKPGNTLVLENFKLRIQHSYTCIITYLTLVPPINTTPKYLQTAVKNKVTINYLELIKQETACM